jgi:hypothetical protein
MQNEYNHWQKDANDSTKALMSIKDSVLPKLISGRIHSIEDSKDGVLILLDQKSGIDFIRENNAGLQGIAARIQWGYNWRTFTIRKTRYTGTKTEFEKRIEQIDKGYIFPAFTLQGYFDSRQNNDLLGIAIIKTKNLYEFILKNPLKAYRNRSDNEFLYVHWHDLMDDKIKIHEPYELIKVEKEKKKDYPKQQKLF